MEVFYGHDALSSHQLQKLLQEIKNSIAKGVTELRAERIYLVDCGKQKLTPDEREKIVALFCHQKHWQKNTTPLAQVVSKSPLQTSPRKFVIQSKHWDKNTPFFHNKTYSTDPLTQKSAAKMFVVTPRIGVVSPWASKAGDAVQAMGIHKVKNIETAILFTIEEALSSTEYGLIGDELHDKMTEEIITDTEHLLRIFCRKHPKTLKTVPVLEGGIEALENVNKTFGLNLDAQEMTYLKNVYTNLRRDPTDSELYMFAQIHSEHCRHKNFHTLWNIDGVKQQRSLFSMIGNTTARNRNRVLSAYSDNAAVMRGTVEDYFYPDPKTGVYGYHRQPVDFLLKVETHNHPTAISPYSGAATGIGGEIRDEAATGVGAKTKAGLTGFSVSNLHIPSFIHSWEREGDRPDPLAKDHYRRAENHLRSPKKQDTGGIHQQKETIDKAPHLASPLDIMLHAPIGGARYGNEFGRPTLLGYFRTFEYATHPRSNESYGYHKPIMIAGGIGNIYRSHIHKKSVENDFLLICLGGPSMRIGLGGGAASSGISSPEGDTLDFASVQRGNAEMQRRCQEVIDTCCRLKEETPIAFIHDVGAGGLANAVPELLHQVGKGGLCQLRAITSADDSLSPLEIWCNESQERYVLAIAEARLTDFDAIARRERCPYAVIGKVQEEQHLVVEDSHFKTDPINLPMRMLFDHIPLKKRTIRRVNAQLAPLDLKDIDLISAIERILRLPTIASKSFLITINDRTITGMVARDQMVGPWQIPVADCAVTTTTLSSIGGEVMAMGERAPLSILSSCASARMAIGETLTNLSASYIEDLSNISLSANWMAAIEHRGEAEKLFDAVRAIGMEFCPALGINIPVGKDSLSMGTKWQQRSVTSPLSLIVSGVALTPDVRKTLTPQLRTDAGDTVLILLDLSGQKNRLGGSCLAQVYRQLGNIWPDVTPETLKAFFTVTQQLHKKQEILAYHDRSDGGLLVTLLEMAFATKIGLNITLPRGEILPTLFNEEIGAVMQVKKSLSSRIIKTYGDASITAIPIATMDATDNITIKQEETVVYEKSRVYLQRCWAETSYKMQALRDKKQTAQQEFDAILDAKDPGLRTEVVFEHQEDTPVITKALKPRVAILRDQGVNGQAEMAAAFTEAGFIARDVHMSDLQSGNITLEDFHVMAACGGFSYGDVFGAGRAWAYNILYNAPLRQQFEAFFSNPNTLVLGVCNGCQMLSQMKSVISGAENWPIFIKNSSEQFEGRFSMVRVEDSDSLWLNSLRGTLAPIAIAHGEGQACFDSPKQCALLEKNKQIALRFTDNYGNPTEKYPANPNGSTFGITALTALKGRMQIMMPHPERVYRTVTNSWTTTLGKQKYSVWMRMFRNARKNFD